MLIVLAGSDSYRLRYETDKLVEFYRTKHAGAVNLFVIDASEENAADQILRPLKYPSFFDEKKCIVVRNGAGAALAGILKQYNLPELDDIVMIAVQNTKHESCDKKVLAVLLKTADRTVTCEPLTGPELSLWAHSFCNTRNTAIEPAALTALIQRTQGDMQSLSNELEKLCSYARGGGITEHMVHTLTPARTEYDEWELSNALAGHDKRSVIAIVWRRLQEGVSEQLLLASLASGIRNLSLVKDAQTRQQTGRTIAETTGLHPFVISKTMRGAAAADATKLRRAHIGLAQLDRHAKDGRADMIDGLFSVLLSL